MEIAEASERRKVVRGDDDVIEHFDFEQLPGADQIACHLDVGITWGTIARGVPVLCGHPSYVQCLGCGALVGLVLWAKGVL